MQSVAPSHPALIAAARHGLDGDLAAPQIAAVVDACDAGAVRMMCRTDRIAGLLAGAVQSGEVVVPPGDLELVMDDWHQGLRACVVVEALLVRVAQRLEAIEARWAVTKGSAVGHLDFPDPSWRLFADVDLVIHPDDWDIVLREIGSDDSVGPHARNFVRRFGKGETLLIDDMEVDLHRRFAVGRFAVRADLADCFVELSSFTLAGRAVPALAPHYRLLHACCHATLGGNSGLRAYRDVAQLVSVHPDCVARMWEAAHRWRVAAVVATAVMGTWERLQLRPDHPVVQAARRLPIGRADRRALAVFATDPRFRPQAMTAIGALPLRSLPGFAWTAWLMSREARL